MKNLINILSYLKNYWWPVALMVIFNLLTTIFSAFSVLSVVPFLDILFETNADQIPAAPPPFSLSSETLLATTNYWLYEFIQYYGKPKALFLVCIAVVFTFLLKNLTRYIAMANLAVIRTGVVRDLRQSIYQKILRLPLSYYSDERKGDILTKSTSDVFEVEWSIIGSLEMLFREPINFIVFFTLLLKINWELTLFVLLLLPVSAFLISRLGKSLKNAAKRGQSKLGEVLSILEETLGGLRIIKAFNAEAQTQTKFTNHNNAHFSLMKRLYRRQYLASPISETMAALTTAIILYYGGNQIISGDTAFDGKFFIAYLILFSQLIPPAKSFSDAFVKVQRGQASADRINEILHADDKIVEPDNPSRITGFNQKIEFVNVSFGYEKELVLKNINITINKGETVALVGPSGGGKSTLADLVPRFYDVSEGDILVDGISIKNIKVTDLRALMGIVSQESILFNDSVHNNIALGQMNASEQEVIQAAKIANAHAFIEQMEEGYHTGIGERGLKLSGGQRQRLSIARAVLKNPPILILDEATSALDTESEQLVQEALNTLMKGRTSLVIAHRLSTIQHADRILVIKDGEIAEQGSHSDLLAANGVYKKLFDLQSFD
jgi:ABC-type multidrug transport system fused ATPase/permease subunit